MDKKFDESTDEKPKIKRRNCSKYSNIDEIKHEKHNFEPRSKGNESKAETQQYENKLNGDENGNREIEKIENSLNKEYSEKNILSYSNNKKINIGGNESVTIEKSVVANENTEKSVVANENTEKSLILNENTENSLILNENTENSLILNENTENSLIVNGNSEKIISPETRNNDSIEKSVGKKRKDSNVVRAIEKNIINYRKRRPAKSIEENKVYVRESSSRSEFIEESRDKKGNGNKIWLSDEIIARRRKFKEKRIIEERKIIENKINKVIDDDLMASSVNENNKEVEKSKIADNSQTNKAMDGIEDNLEGNVEKNKNVMVENSIDSANKRVKKNNTAEANVNYNDNLAYYFLRSRFVTSKKTKEVIEKNKLIFKKGLYSKIEADIVRNGVNKFLAERNLKMSDLENYLVDGTEFPIYELISEVVRDLKFRTFKSLWTHVYFNYTPLENKRFDDDNCIELLQLVKEKGYQWLVIGRIMEKYRDVCRQQYLGLTGERKNRLTEKAVRELIERGIPQTEEQWEATSNKIGVTRKILENKIVKFFKKRMFTTNKTCYEDIELMLYVLHFNYFCAVNFIVKEFLDCIDDLVVKCKEMLDNDSLKDFEPTLDKQITQNQIDLKQINIKLDLMSGKMFDEQFTGDGKQLQVGDTQVGDTQVGDTQVGDTQVGDTQVGDTQVGNTQPGNTQPGNTQPGNTQPGNTQPGNTQPGNTQVGDTQQLGNTQPGNTQPGNTQQDTQQDTQEDSMGKKNNLNNVFLRPGRSRISYKKYFEENNKVIEKAIVGMDLSVKITIEDIFWTNIGEALVMDSVAARSRMIVLQNIYRFNTYEDLYNTIMELSYRCFIEKLKYAIIN